MRAYSVATASNKPLAQLRAPEVLRPRDRTFLQFPTSLSGQLPEIILKNTDIFRSAY